jgi:Trypsin
LQAEKAEVHPEYDRVTKVNDVALLMLSEEANITAYVLPICLWDDDYDLDRINGFNATVRAHNFFSNRGTRVS